MNTNEEKIVNLNEDSKNNKHDSASFEKMLKYQNTEKEKLNKQTNQQSK